MVGATKERRIELFQDAFSKLLEERQTNVFKVSKEVKIPVTTMYDWLNGRTKPKFESVIKLSKHFDVPLEYFNE